MYIYLIHIYIYLSCLQRYLGTFKDESLMTIRDLREQRLVENSLIRGGVVPLLEHDHPRLARAEISRELINTRRRSTSS